VRYSLFALKVLLVHVRCQRRGDERGISEVVTLLAPRRQDISFHPAPRRTRDDGPQALSSR
jgi:hypothetical protein